jgi:hypothetical protein
MPPYRAETTSDPVRSLSRRKLEITNEGIDSPDREPQSPSRSISQKVSVADVLGQTVYRDCNNYHWIELGRLRENNKVPERSDHSRRDQTAINLNF